MVGCVGGQVDTRHRAKIVLVPRLTETGRHGSSLPLQYHHPNRGRLYLPLDQFDSNQWYKTAKSAYSQVHRGSTQAPTRHISARIYHPRNFHIRNQHFRQQKRKKTYPTIYLKLFLQHWLLCRWCWHLNRLPSRRWGDKSACWYCA